MAIYQDLWQIFAKNQIFDFKAKFLIFNVNIWIFAANIWKKTITLITVIVVSRVMIGVVI